MSFPRPRDLRSCPESKGRAIRARKLRSFPYFADMALPAGGGDNVYLVSLTSSFAVCVLLFSWMDVFGTVVRGIRHNLKAMRLFGEISLLRT